MKTLFFPNRQNGVRYFKDPVKIDTAKNTVESVDTIRLDLFSTYYADEDLEIRYTEKGKTNLLKANKGDIIFVFYDYDHIKNKVAVVKNAAIKENIASLFAMRSAKQAEKESYAKTCNDPCCDCCECCESC